jgi:cytochrome oxidase assembly protein ShyY1
MSKRQPRSTIKWIIALVAFLLLPVLVGLGKWQLERAEQKTELLQQWQQQTVYLAGLPGLPVSMGTRVQLSGELDDKRWFLLDNRVRDGEVGYEVLALFQPVGESLQLLVNLGWVKADVDRSVLPEVSLPAGKIDIQGRLINPKNALQLAQDHWITGWPKRVQGIDIARIKAHINRAMYPALLRVSEPIVPELKTGWRIVNMPPEKHLGYAFQWFALAFVLATGMGWLGWQGARKAWCKERV